MKSWLFYCDDCSDSLDLGDRANHRRVRARMSAFIIVIDDRLGSVPFRHTHGTKAHKNAIYLPIQLSYQQMRAASCLPLPVLA